MKQKILSAIALFALCLATIILTAQTGRTEFVEAIEIKVPKPDFPSNSAPQIYVPDISRACALKPEPNRTTPSSRTTIASSQISLERFRRVENFLNTASDKLTNPSGLSSYTPKESIALAHPTNYGERFVLDLYGKSAYHPPIVVIHETVGSAGSAINMFRTLHRREKDQVSYHTLIKLDGEIVYIVPPDQRAYGAGNSIFEGDSGNETVKTHPNYPPSVNNFAYHISLETPRDGRNNRSRHSGYTSAQYQSLAWLVAKTGVPDSRVTTHQSVDRSGLRRDPRSFDYSTFMRLLQAQPRTNAIAIDCQPPS